MAASKTEERLLVFETGIGWMGVLHLDRVLLRVRIGLGGLLEVVSAFPECDCGPSDPDAWEKKLIARMQRSLSKASSASVRKSEADLCFSDLRIEDAHLTEFQQKVVNAVRGLGFGETATYGEIADRIGHPRAARAVGTVMKHNRYPIVVPCHRVLSAGGIGGFNAPRGVSTKRQMLLIEGHQLKSG